MKVGADSFIVPACSLLKLNQISQTLMPFLKNRMSELVMLEHSIES